MGGRPPAESPALIWRATGAPDQRTPARPGLPAFFTGFAPPLGLMLLLLLIAVHGAAAPADSGEIHSVSQLRQLSGEAFQGECPGRLSGTITLVDTNRHLAVLQDATGAAALDLGAAAAELQAGEQWAVEFQECHPYTFSFPDYPYRPSGRNIEAAFEAPSNWGEFHLTRMRGYLHPPATGDYTFWIASDNSSELWLSTNREPAKTRKIASVPENSWAQPHEWTRFPSQRSESIALEAGGTYYIEAIQEQSRQDENLAVAWQGPGQAQAVIASRYLTPWKEAGPAGAANRASGILREFWTGFSGGSLAGITPPKNFQSALSLKEPKLTRLGAGRWPEPLPVAASQALEPSSNYRWARAEGVVSFAGRDGDGATLELSGRGGRFQVRAPHWNSKWPGEVQNRALRVEGVCESACDATGQTIAGLLWATAPHSLTVVETAPSNAATSAAPYALPPRSAAPDSTMSGAYWTRGVVTFCDRVLGKDCLFVQEEREVAFIAQTNRSLQSQLQVGRWIEVMGHLTPGTYPAVLDPLVVKPLGWCLLPEPANETPDIPSVHEAEGRWIELEGVVHSASADGTLELAARNGSARVWIGGRPLTAPTQLVDAQLRARGVFSRSLLGSPTLLVPSGQFVEVEHQAPADPFGLATVAIATLRKAAAQGPCPHRVKIAGTVSYRSVGSAYVEDESGGVHVYLAPGSSLQVGDEVEAAGFPEANGSSLDLTGVLIRPTGKTRGLTPHRTTLEELVAARSDGALVRLAATLLRQQGKAVNVMLDLQDGQRVFQAVLPANHGLLPPLVPGCRLELTGVCELELPAPQSGDKADWQSAPAASVRLWLRSAADVAVLSRPPWLSLRWALALIGLLLTVLAVTLLAIHWLRRRLEKQQAAQLAFAKGILESQESERRRIAANLHDSLGQNLLVIKNQARLAMQPAGRDPLLQQRLEQISGIASQALEEVRQITHDLRPYQLDRLGLARAIRAVIEHMAEDSSIRFAHHVDEIDGRLSRESEIHLYRIVQEGLSNIVKHSGATEATVVVKSHTNALTLSIRDNGRGFEPEPGQAAEALNAGFGLGGMRERARILGGRLTLDTRPGQGLAINLEIPMEKG